MIFRANGKPLVGGIEAGAACHRPAFQDAIHFQPEIIMQTRRVMLLDDEAIAACAFPFSRRFLRSGKVALAIIFLQRVGFGHMSCPLARGSLGAGGAPRSRFLGGRAFRPGIDGFLQRRHQIDNVAAALDRSLILVLDDAAALGLLLLFDQPLKRIDITVVEAVGFERRRFLFNERFGKVEQFRIGLHILNFAKVGLGAIDLIGIAKRLQHHAATTRL